MYTLYKLFVTLGILQVFFVKHEVSCGAVAITKANFVDTIKNNEYVILNFCVNWSPFCQKLDPIYDEAADKIKTIFPQPSKVLLGKVNGETELYLRHSCNMYKFPTFLIAQNGLITRRQYTGNRTVDAIVNFVKKDATVQIKKFHSHNQLIKHLNYRNRTIIGYFDETNNPEYDTFRRVATALKDKCEFYTVYIPKNADRTIKPIEHGPKITFRPSIYSYDRKKRLYHKNITNYEDLFSWSQKLCTPLVRPITRDFLQYIIDNKKDYPQLTLYHAANDTQSVEDFTRIVESTLHHEKKNISFFTADGFALEDIVKKHYKSRQDLPFIVLDISYESYLFPDFQDIYLEGKLKQFLLDYYSGKLSFEYRYKRDPVYNVPPEEAATIENFFKFSHDNY